MRMRMREPDEEDDNDELAEEDSDELDDEGQLAVSDYFFTLNFILSRF